MKRSLLVLLFCLLFLQQNIFPQMSVNKTGDKPHPSAMLDISSNNQGISIPNVALSATNTALPVASPKGSLLLYNTATSGTGNTAVAPGYYYWDNAKWIPIASYLLQQNMNTNSKVISGDGSNNGLSFYSNGAFVSRGQFNTGNAFSEAGAGTKLIWYPERAAFRAGWVDGTYWDHDNIGFQSVAFGRNTKATGICASALGAGTSASGNYSLAFGSSSQATGDLSVAGGDFSWSDGRGAVAFGNATALGTYSFSAGYSTRSVGNSSVSFGSGCNAISDYSFASGDNSIANGVASVALGTQNTAKGSSSLAAGSKNVANDFAAIALGAENWANRPVSISIGFGCTSDGQAALAMGYFSNALFNGATAIGAYNTASRVFSTALGSNTTANADFSTSMGNDVTTNGLAGSFIIGDHSGGGVTGNNNTNQMMMRFAGGYVFYSDAAWNHGVVLYPGDGSWSVISDKRKKEKFSVVDGEDFLRKISRFHLTSWNFKGQDNRSMRHYGPMAQDFYAAFGKDQYGTIGNDTTINQADFDGVNFIAIQALEKRTRELKKQNEALQQELREQKKENEMLKDLVLQRLKKMERTMNQPIEKKAAARR